MRSYFFVTILLLGVLFANAVPAKPEPDVGKVTDNTFRSDFFGFQCSFPQGWSTLNDDVRRENNRKRHQASVKEAEAKAPRDTPNRTTTVQVFWIYDLLIATPGSLAANAKPPLPHVHIWAMERFGLFDKAGDDEKQIANLATVKVLRASHEETISGHRFVRTDFIHHDDNFEALFETVSGKYLLHFEFRGRNEQEINELAKTMESLKFDSK